LGEEGQNMEIGMIDRKGMGERDQSITRKWEVQSKSNLIISGL